MIDEQRHCRLVYVMGPSGAGKDSVLGHARRTLDGRHPIAFAHRYITRPTGEDIENYIALSPNEFELRRTRGLFAFDWEAYGWRYGIGQEIELWRSAGLIVVIDGSRQHFLQHRAALSGALPVLITAAPDILRQRLIERGREDVAAIDRRLERAKAYAPAAPDLVTIDNSGPLGNAGAALAALLIKLAPST
jgi:ribose 1,5-bisphosphokinase